MRCDRYSYPVDIWVQRSLVFALSTTGLIALATYTAGLMTSAKGWQIVFIFFIILIVALSNLFLHMKNRVLDPIKSPLYVKVASFSIAIFVILCFDIFEGALDLRDPMIREIAEKSVWRHFFIISIQACFLNFIVLLWLYFLMSDHFKVLNELAHTRLEKSKEEAINRMLRQQIQPHFLFNALATLKSLMWKDTVLAEEYLLRLSDFLRSSIVAGKTEELNSVAEEIRLCTNYLDMQKIRFGDALYYQIDLPASLDEKQLPFFSLQPLVDNAIKHNSFTIEAPLCITITEESGCLLVSNKKNSKKNAVESNGSGLKNLMDRYKNYLQDAVLIEDTATHFKVKIKLL